MNNFWTGEKWMIWAQGLKNDVDSYVAELPYNTVLIDKN